MLVYQGVCLWCPCWNPKVDSLESPTHRLNASCSWTMSPGAPDVDRSFRSNHWAKGQAHVDLPTPWIGFGSVIVSWLVVWNIFLCFHILRIIIPIDWYFSEGFKPSTSSCWWRHVHSAGMYGWAVTCLKAKFKMKRLMGGPSSGALKKWTHQSCMKFGNVKSLPSKNTSRFRALKPTLAGWCLEGCPSLSER